MEIKKKRIFTDKEGEKEEVEFLGGIKQTLLLKPSSWYVKNLLKPIKEEQKREEKRIEHKSKIQEKLREIAERELEKEGKL
ncbi:unnamed protein product [marine sediment metagenome]|uniref:Uncharacterized protein n=1 Tax=marine sediment metagenome TaxID=412755 RepID=X1H6D9_9ZZZZ